MNFLNINLSTKYQINAFAEQLVRTRDAQFCINDSSENEAYCFSFLLK